MSRDIATNRTSTGNLTINRQSLEENDGTPPKPAPRTMARRRILRPLQVRFSSVTHLTDRSVEDSTAQRYVKAVQTHTALGFSADYAGLVRRIQQYDPISSDELKLLRSSIQHHLRRHQRPTMSAEQVAVATRLILGRARVTQEGRTARGAIDWDKLTFLLDTLRAEPYHLNEPTLRAILLCWCCALRTSQMSKVCPRDFTVEKGGNITLRLTKIHDPKLLARGGVRLVEVRTVEKRGRDVLRLFLRCTPGEKDPLFPKNVWLPSRVNRWVKEIAAANPDVFDPDLEWDGAHCFRHGVATTVLAETGQLDRVLKVTGQATVQMGKHYGRTNAERKTLVNKKVPRGRAAAKTAKKSTTKTCLVGKAVWVRERWTCLYGDS